MNNETEQWLDLQLAKQEPWGKSKKRGYAARPGTGPAGETCGTCRFLVRKKMSKTVFKCGLMHLVWTCSEKTDILGSAPACSRWVPAHNDIPGKEQKTIWAKS